MLFPLSRRLPRSYPVLALVATHLVISMPAPSTVRSPEEAPHLRNGFSNVPKILEIQLPLKIASKDDLVAWARYVMSLMASKINITLTAVKESPSKSSGTVRPPDRSLDNARQSQFSRNTAYRSYQGVNQMAGYRNLNTKSVEQARYAENVRNLGNLRNFERSKVPANVRNLENSRQSENIRYPVGNGNLPLPRAKQLSDQRLPASALNGVTSSSLFDKINTNFPNVGFSDTTVPSPVEIAASVNLQKARDKESLLKEALGTANILKAGNPQLFVPQLPDFGPAVDVWNNDIFGNVSLITPPSRAYLPATTIDSLRFPNDPFVTRYFFDGVERNVSRNLAVHSTDLAFTTHNPLILNEGIPLPLKSVELLPRRNSSSFARPLFKVPFEAVITFTRESSVETTTLRNEKESYIVVNGGDPPDDVFPPYLDANHTQTNESGRINVVFDDADQANVSRNGTTKDERNKQERRKKKKKKSSSMGQRAKQENSSKREPSIVGQFLKTFVAIRRNNSLPVDLSPPPLSPQRPRTPQMAAEKFPAAQRYPPYQRTQPPYTDRPPSRQRRRNQTSLAQEIEDDDEGNGNNESEDSTENDDGNGNDDVESKEEADDSGSNESSSSEEDYDDEDDDEGGGSIKAIIDLLQLVAPVLEDLSDPDSDADIADVIEAGIPLLQELSEGDGENPGSDIPGLLVPILLQLSGGEDGQRDSAAILTPLLQLIAPLIGPLVGPLIVPLSRQSSKQPGQGGSSSGDIIKSLSGPLLQPIGYGKMSPLSNLIAGTIASLSKSSSYGKSDISSLVKAIVAGSVAGTSAGSSGQKDSYAAPTSYGGDYGYGGNPSPYGNAAVPSKHSNPLLLLGSSIKDILNAILKVVASLVNAITGVLGASSNSSTEPKPSYGPPSPPTYHSPNSYAVPSGEPISITTRSPRRPSRL